MQAFAEVPLHQLFRCHHPVEVGVQVLTGSDGGHLGLADLRVELVFAEVGTLLVLLLVHVELLHGDAALRPGNRLGHLERLFRHFRHQFGRVVTLHQLRFQLLPVHLGGEVPFLRVGLALVGMAVGHFLSVGCHHLRLARLALLFLLGFFTVLGFHGGPGFLFLGRFFPGSILHSPGRLFLCGLFLFLLCHICMI